MIQLGIDTRTIRPTRYVLVEGFLVFYPEKSRSYFDIKVFLDISEDEIIRRRYERMSQGGGHYSDEYIRKTLIEAHRKYILPQKQFADLVLDANKPIEVSAKEVLKFIQKVPKS